jgi:MFS family permease
VLLIAFVVIEMRSSAPLLPLRVPLERTRGGSFLASMLIGAGLFAMFLFLTYYFQASLGYSALKTGFAFLPFSIGIILSAGIASQFLPRTGPKLLMLLGAALGIIGLFMLTGIGLDTSYVGHVLPSEILISIGMGLVFVPLSSACLFGIEPHDAGVASALINTTQQVGGSLGTALLNTVFATAVTNYLVGKAATPGNKAQAQIEGYTTAFVWGGAMLVIAFVVIAILVKGGREESPAHDVAAQDVAEQDVAERVG